ncbi:MAG: hypothetical protein K6U87_07420 [Firmicutes bacterium]|nr:hypothetical protein [Bacillota bacterium]
MTGFLLAMLVLHLAGLALVLAIIPKGYQLQRRQRVQDLDIQSTLPQVSESEYTRQRLF